MYENRRRRRYRDKKKPVATASAAAFGAALVLVAVFVALVIVSAQNGGTMPNVLVAVGMVALFASIAALVAGIQALHNENFDGLFRILGVALPALALILWAGMYLLGMFLG